MNLVHESDKSLQKKFSKALFRPKIDFRTIEICFSLLFGFILANLAIDGFVDRDNYLNYLSTGVAIELAQANSSSSYYSIVFNEPLWLLISGGLALNFNAEISLRILIFFSSVMFFIGITRQFSTHQKMDWLILFLLIILSPQILKNYIIHLRQGLAISVFLILIPRYARPGLLGTYPLAVAALIHSSFFILFAVSGLLVILAKLKFSLQLRILVVTCGLTIVALLYNQVTGFLELRQASEDLLADKGSGAGFGFWLIILSFLAISEYQIRSFGNNKWLEFSVCSILLYLILYFVSPRSSRIFESSLPIIIIALVAIKSKFGVLIKIMLLLQFLYLWFPALVGKQVFRAAYS